MENYYNQLSEDKKIEQLAKCRFMDFSEFNDGVSILINKKIVIVGCGAQGLNQGLNMRDSGLNISYALRQSAIDHKRDSYLNASILAELFNLSTMFVTPPCFKASVIVSQPY